MRIKIDNTLCLIIDLQEKLLPHISNREELLRNVTILLKGVTKLAVPVFYTEQYPKGLGETVKEIKTLLDDANAKHFIKNTFSCCGIPNFLSEIECLKRKTVIIAGIEAHICVLQTVIDLLEKGFMPVIMEDCISSRKEKDKEVALKRIISEGGVVSTVESILFELLNTSEHPSFKDISKLVK